MIITLSLRAVSARNASGWFVISMLIGLMSDSHDNFPGLLEAVEIFKKRNVEMILHAGDVVAPGMCYAFEGWDGELYLVYGNNDGDRTGLKRDFARVGGEFLEDFGEIEADGRRIALLHGTYEPLVRGLVGSGRYDVVVRGHDHHVRVVPGDALMINPGEVWGHFTGRKTVAILDTKSLATEIVEMGSRPSIVEMTGKQP
ncbi:MAG TPA: metallophosphoesterase [Methanothrix sp.]|nr:metallophosphoesterase [Methanothrix sp.]